MPDRKPKPDRPTPRKEKICKTCGRPFAYQKKWAQDWDIVKHCSDTCRDKKATVPDAALEQAILTLLAERSANGDRGKTICPSEAAKLVAGGPSGSARDKEKSHRLATGRPSWNPPAPSPAASSLRARSSSPSTIRSSTRPPQKALSASNSDENRHLNHHKPNPLVFFSSKNISKIACQVPKTAKLHKRKEIDLAV
jgi:hypothetical protein